MQYFKRLFSKYKFYLAFNDYINIQTTLLADHLAYEAKESGSSVFDNKRSLKTSIKKMLMEHQHFKSGLFVGEPLSAYLIESAFADMLKKEGIPYKPLFVVSPEWYTVHAELCEVAHKYFGLNLRQDGAPLNEMPRLTLKTLAMLVNYCASSLSTKSDPQAIDMARAYFTIHSPEFHQEMNAIFTSAFRGEAHRPINYIRKINQFLNLPSAD